MDINHLLPILLATAWLLPLASFTLIVFFGSRMGKAGHGAGYLATGAIVTGFLLSVVSLVIWLTHHPIPRYAPEHAAAHVSADPSSAHGEKTAAAVKHAADAVHASGEAKPAEAAVPAFVSGDWYSLGEFGKLHITIGYYIDALTVAMFCMVTLIASCIHIYSFGYMHEELHDVTDSLVTLSNGQTLRRRGRFHRFYQYLSLFCFSMLGLVLSGNVAMVFVFWELVGICSYFLIGFYIERKSASNAANKAFIVNRVGDFGMIIGLMAVWTGMGTFSFADYRVKDAAGNVSIRPGIFSQVRPEKGDGASPAEAKYQLQAPDGMVRWSKQDDIEKIVLQTKDKAVSEKKIAELVPQWRKEGFGYGLLVIAGLGIFCGCVGKSAQFPLHVWLPDAMEGPTPVSALIHAATMVAAGVYLVGRFYPVFAPEVLIVIACIGATTLFIAATIALVATDIKRVLAYSTVSQLGYMMFALGIGGWVAGILHLFTHAFFKALLFLCSGSVIHATGTNEMPKMGGLLKKMPFTAYTMLVGCLAIAGAGIPLVLGLSGYYSKDAIIAQGLVFKATNPIFGPLFYVAVGGAGMTAFYMFRLWFMTFLGKPRDEEIHHHAHESPWTMVGPLVVLAAFSIFIAWTVPFSNNWKFESLLRQAYPVGTECGQMGQLWSSASIPDPGLTHSNEVHISASLIAFTIALVGFVLAVAFYGVRSLDPDDARRTFSPFYRMFKNKWWFDELYNEMLVRPVHVVSGWISNVDKKGIDWCADNLARLFALGARLDDWFDRNVVDRLIDATAKVTYVIGIRLRTLQTGNVRQYVMFLTVGTVALFAVVSFYLNFTTIK